MSLAAMPGILIVLTMGYLGVMHLGHLWSQRERIEWTGRGWSLPISTRAPRRRGPVEPGPGQVGPRCNDVVVREEASPPATSGTCTAGSFMGNPGMCHILVLRRDTDDSRSIDPVPAILAFDRQLRDRGASGAVPHQGDVRARGRGSDAWGLPRGHEEERHSGSVPCTGLPWLPPGWPSPVPSTATGPRRQCDWLRSCSPRLGAGGSAGGKTAELSRRDEEDRQRRRPRLSARWWLTRGRCRRASRCIRSHSGKIVARGGALGAPIWPRR